MNITINTLERNTADDTVVIAHWNAVVEESHMEKYSEPTIDGETEFKVVDYSASAYGSQSFTRDENSPAFIPFEDLTEAEVVGWVKDSMISTKDIPAELDEDGNEVTPATIETVDGMADIEANLQAQIDEQKTPTTVSGVPWNNPVAEAA